MTKKNLVALLLGLSHGCALAEAPPTSGDGAGGDSSVCDEQPLQKQCERKEEPTE